MSVCDQHRPRIAAVAWYPFIQQCEKLAKPCREMQCAGLRTGWSPGRIGGTLRPSREATGRGISGNNSSLKDYYAAHVVKSVRCDECGKEKRSGGSLEWGLIWRSASAKRGTTSSGLIDNQSIKLISCPTLSLRDGTDVTEVEGFYTSLPTGDISTSLLHLHG
jgi:hypothetical protein